jgi:hypothetical protein
LAGSGEFLELRRVFGTRPSKNPLETAGFRALRADNGDDSLPDSQLLFSLRRSEVIRVREEARPIRGGEQLVARPRVSDDLPLRVERIPVHSGEDGVLADSASFDLNRAPCSGKWIASPFRIARNGQRQSRSHPRHRVPYSDGRTRGRTSRPWRACQDRRSCSRLGQSRRTPSLCETLVAWAREE